MTAGRLRPSGRRPGRPGTATGCGPTPQADPGPLPGRAQAFTKGDALHPPRTRPSLEGRAPSGDDDPTVVFLGHDLACGGAERTYVQLVERMRTLRPVPALVARRGELLSRLEADLPLYDLECPASELIRDGSPPRGPAREGNRPDPDRAGQGPSAALHSLARKTHRLAHLCHETGARVVSTFLHKSHVIATLARMAHGPGLRMVANVHSVVSRSAAYLDPTRPEHRHLERIARVVLPGADLVVAVSDEVKRDLVDRIGVHPSRIAVIPPPLELGTIRREARAPLDGDGAWREGGARIVAAGRLVPEKGFDVLVRAFARLQGDSDIRLAILGEGPERPRLERLIRSLGVDGRVELPGYRPDPWRWMARADLYVLPSRLEAFPRVLGEAMALDLPIVASACSDGVRDYLERGRSGLLVPPEDPAALASGIRRALRRDALRARLRASGRRRAGDFEAASVARRYEAALAGILPRRGPAPRPDSVATGPHDRPRMW